MAPIDMMGYDWLMHSTEFPDSFYRVTIKGLCVRDGKVMLVHESKDRSDKWELPGGGLDFGEDIVGGFKREIQEEMVLSIIKMSKSPIYVWTHKYVGRRNLQWYYSCVIAYRVEFEDLNITPTDECDRIQFFSKEELRGLPFAGQLDEFPSIFDPKDFAGTF